MKGKSESEDAPSCPTPSVAKNFFGKEEIWEINGFHMNILIILLQVHI